jgi:hypothetical protein
MAAINPGDLAIAALDFNNAEDNKFYQKAIKGMDESERYDLTPIKLKSFLDNVRQRAVIYGWNDVLNVPTLAVAPAIPINHVINNYGVVSMAECVAHANAYMLARDRTAQNAAMLYHFLFASLTQEARNKVNIDPTIFTIQGINDGLCFLRTIIAKAQLDTIGTVETLRNKLGELPVKLVELSGNIMDFHQYVNTIMNALDSYNQTYPEIVSNLFKAYKIIEEREFATYIMITRHGYQANPLAYQPRLLMEGVENHYKLAIEAGTWDPNMVKKESAEITALKLEIEALRVETHKNSKDKRGNAGRRTDKPKYEWKKIPPSEGEAKSKKFEDRTYHWCPNHKYWTMHTPEECKGVGFSPSRSNNQPQAAVNMPQAMSTSIQPEEKKSVEVMVKEAMQTIVEYSDNFHD